MSDCDRVARLKSAMSVQSDLQFYDLRTAIQKLVAYCEAHNWAGYDPYDALNSALFRTVPLLDVRVARLLATQALKRSPVNIRRLIAIPATQNPKAIALFLSAFIQLSQSGEPAHGQRVGLMIDWLIALRSPGVPYWCWGYSFPWQTRTLLVPAGTPNLVCTSFVANALLDAFEYGYDSSCLNMALSAADYILDKLYWTDGDSVAGFSYPMPGCRGQVHNANFLGAALLCRVYKHVGEPKYLESALRVARYSAWMQRPDGSWPYGEAPSQGWIDNFHTGFNLCALRSLCRSVEAAEFEPYARRGFTFYRRYFFREDNIPRYFHDRTYPVDIHCVAQSIITLLKLRDIGDDNVLLASEILRWAMVHMWDDRGFFYYRVLRSYTIRIPYMRWSQAWMLVAMTLLLDEYKRGGVNGANSRRPVVQGRLPA